MCSLVAKLTGIGRLEKNYFTAAAGFKTVKISIWFFTEAGACPFKFVKFLSQKRVSNIK